MKSKSGRRFWNILNFTVVQSFKSGSTKVVLILLSVAMLVSMPLLYYIGKQSGQEEFLVKTIFVWDQTEMGFNDFSDLKEKSHYRNVEFYKVDSQQELKEASMQITISFGEQGYMLEYMVPVEGGMEEVDFDAYSEDFIQCFEKQRLQKLDVSPEEKEYLGNIPEYKVSYLDEKGQVPAESEEGISLTQYNVLLGSVVVMILLIAFSAEIVSSSIVSEKSSKLVETLMLSAKPSSIIAGKVIGAMCTVVLELVAVGICACISLFLTKVIFGLNTVIIPQQIQDFVKETSGLPLEKVCILFLFLLAGVCFYALLAGLFGAAISKIEDMAEGMKTYNFIMIIGAYSGIGLSMAQIMGNGAATVSYVLSFIPICAPFVVPMQLLAGKISISFALAGLVVLIGFTVFLARFVGKVYQVMLLHQGNTLKFRDIISLGRKETHK